jgi:non-specific protein-tyrosine kinase
MDDSIRTKEDLERAGSGMPVLGLIPTVINWKDKAKPSLVSLVEPTSSAAEAYRSLRTSIQFLAVDSPLHLLQTTSAREEEGKTTTVANLGVAFAAAGERTLIICCDLRRPRIHEFFGLSNEVGLTSLLLGRMPLGEAIQPVPGQELLYLLASGPLPANPSEVLQSKPMARIIEEVRTTVDKVLIDCPPVIPVTDAVALSSAVDATLLVASGKNSHARAVARAVELLEQVNAPLVGTVLNSAPTESRYADNYYYYRDNGRRTTRIDGNSAPDLIPDHSYSHPYANRPLRE